jgi:RNA polymerase sigma-70 factor (ECF subfamily)
MIIDHQDADEFSPGHAPMMTATKGDPVEDVETRECLATITAAIQTDLSPHQREVLTALVLADVPIDVLAERLNTTRGALYKTLHDARRKLRNTIDENHD